MRNESAVDHLRVAQFHAWNAELDEALLALPEMDNASHELYRLVARNSSGTQKHFSLVTHDGAPVAVVGLRQRQRHWEQLGCGILPGTTIPATAGYEIPAMAASGLDIWMKLIDEEPAASGLRSLFSIPVRRMNCSDDAEHYWHESGLWGMVKSARRRTKKYSVEVDAPGAAAWTINQWAQKWRTQETEIGRDLVVAAEYYQTHGRYHTFRLVLDGTPVAGNTFFVANGRLIYQTTFFDDTYKRDAVGTRLLDFVFQWAADAGYRQIDLGGGHEYKTMWAPENGRIWSYNVCPKYVYLRRQAVQFARRIGWQLASSRDRAAAQPASTSSPGALAIALYSAQELL